MKKNKSSASSSDPQVDFKNSDDIEEKIKPGVKNSKKRQPKSKVANTKVSKKASPNKAKIKTKKSSKPKTQKIKLSKENESKNQGHPKTEEKFVPDSVNLPDGYGDHRLIFIARDPRWAFCFWEIDFDKVEKHLSELGNSYSQARWKLRVYCQLSGEKTSEGLYSDFDLELESGKAYLELTPPGSTFSAELGVMDSQNNFCRILISNSIDLPPDKPSESLDEIWTHGEDIHEDFSLSNETRVKKQKLKINIKSEAIISESSSSRYSK